MTQSVKILTFHYARNYGAVLQTYALTQVIQALGFHVEVIDFRAPEFSSFISWKNPMSFFNHWIFSSFVKKYIPLTVIKYSSLSDLKLHKPKADYYIVGSDQVWNYMDITGKYKDLFYFSFLDPTDIKIAYGASFGREKIDDISALTKLLAPFKAISVREESALSICAQAGRNDATQVLDPTLLIPDFSTLIGSSYHNTSHTKLSCFFLQTMPDDYYKLVQNIARHLNVRPVVLGRKTPLKGFRRVPFLSVIGLLKNLAASSFVVTNSFHGVALSISLKRNFIFISSSAKLNTRVVSLLNLLGLQDRFFANCQAAERSDIWQQQINYNSVHKILEEKRRESQRFLTNALNFHIPQEKRCQ